MAWWGKSQTRLYLSLIETNREVGVFVNWLGVYKWNLKYYIDRKTFKRPNRNDSLVVRASCILYYPHKLSPPPSTDIHSWLELPEKYRALCQI